MFSRDLTVLPAHPHVHLQSESAIPAFAFPAIAGSQLWLVLIYRPRRDGRLSWPGAGYVVRQFTRPKKSRIPLLTGAQFSTTALIERNVAAAAAAAAAAFTCDKYGHVAFNAVDAV